MDAGTEVGGGGGDQNGEAMKLAFWRKSTERVERPRIAHVEQAVNPESQKRSPVKLDDRPVFQFDFSVDGETAWQTLNEALHLLSEANGVWYLQSQEVCPSLVNTAGGMLSAPRICILQHLPSTQFHTNVAPWSLSVAGWLVIWFLPNRLAFYRPGRADSSPPLLRYSDISSVVFTTSVSTLQEPTVSPPVADIIRWRWTYERKDGEPDQRYTHNPCFPVIRTGIVGFGCSDERQIFLTVSPVASALRVAELFGRAFGVPCIPVDMDEDSTDETAESSGEPKRRRSKHPAKETIEKPIPTPYEVLDIGVGSTFEQVTVAYRSKAQQYHPDRVATMGPEIREVAERKMKEINAAYEALKARAAR